MNRVEYLREHGWIELKCADCGSVAVFYIGTLPDDEEHYCVCGSCKPMEEPEKVTEESE